MNYARVMLIIMGVLMIAIASCSSEHSLKPTMTCKISRKAGDCTSVPTLSSGQLKIMQGGQFKLNGQYNACYHEETVSIDGKYQRSDYDKRISIELLATEIKGRASSEFPSTIAVVTLNKASLKGIISDVWATIRSPMQSNDKPVIDIICKAD